MSKNRLTKSQKTEKAYHKRINQQKAIVKYKERFGLKSVSQTSMEEDIEKETYLRSLPDTGISGSVSKLGSKVKNTRKKAKKKDKVNFYKSKEWRMLRYKALKLYGRQCLCCGAKPPKVVLHVDHIKPRSDYPELELDITNLQILCEDCNMGKLNTDCIDYR